MDIRDKIRLVLGIAAVAIVPLAISSLLYLKMEENSIENDRDKRAPCVFLQGDSAENRAHLFFGADDFNCNREFGNYSEGLESVVLFDGNNKVFEDNRADIGSFLSKAISFDNLAYGKHDFYLVAKDLAGNKRESEHVIIEVKKPEKKEANLESGGRKAEKPATLSGLSLQACPKNLQFKVTDLGDNKVGIAYEVSGGGIDRLEFYFGGRKAREYANPGQSGTFEIRHAFGTVAYKVRVLKEGCTELVSERNVQAFQKQN